MSTEHLDTANPPPTTHIQLAEFSLSSKWREIALEDSFDNNPSGSFRQLSSDEP
jgi:hypothetical protein